MPKLWSDEAIQQQIEVNRDVRALKDLVTDQLIDPFLPTLVRADVEIPPGKSGFCTFLRGDLKEDKTEADEKETMHNLVSDAVIHANDICLAQRVMLPRSQAGWVVFRIRANTSEGGGGTQVTRTCNNCSGGVFRQPYLSISGLVDVAAHPQFDGWAEHPGGVNGDHLMDLVPAFGQGGTNFDCKATLTLPVPIPSSSDPFSRFEEGVLHVEFIPVAFGGNVQLNFHTTVTSIGGFGIGFPVQYGENQASWPANQFPRNGNLPVCESTYDDWTEYHVADGWDDLSTWLGNGTFRINP